MGFIPGPPDSGGGGGGNNRTGGNPIGSVIGGLFGAWGSSRQNKWNRQEADRNRKWQEYMSNTAVTRRMRDMAAAGINPILAGKYDASSPPGSLAHNMTNVAEGAMNGATTALNLKLQEKNLEALDATIENTKANTEERRANVDNITERTILTRYGNEVASLTADLAKTYRELEGNMTPQQRADWVRSQIRNLRPKVTEALSKIAGSAQRVTSLADEALQAIERFVFGTENEPTAEDRREFNRPGYSYDAWKEYKRNGGTMNYKQFREQGTGKWQNR